MPAIINAALAVAVLLMVLWGLVMCFFGYRIIKIVLAFYGFVAGMGAGVLLSVFALQATGISAFLLVLVCGAAGAIVFVLLLHVGIFLLGAALVAGLVWLVAWAVGRRVPPAWLLAPGLVGGILALVFRRFIVIVFTAFQGASDVVLGALFLMNDPVVRSVPDFFLRQRPLRPALSRTHLVALAAWIGLAVLGMIAQYASAPDRDARRGRNKNLGKLLERAREDQREGD